ncbi:MAG: cytochrome c biogenesis protein CcsA [bacterium]
MNRPDALFYSIAFYSYLIAFLFYIVHIALKKQRLGQIATALVAIGIIPHTVAFFSRWVVQGHIPLANMYEYMGLMSWMVAVGLLYFVLRYKNHRIGIFIDPIMVILLVVASLLPSEVNRQLMPALQSTWLAIHVTLAAIGSGAFLIAFAAAALYLLTEKLEGIKNLAEVNNRIWMAFGIFWIGVPIVLTLVLKGFGLLPVPVDLLTPTQLSRLSASQITSFAFVPGSSPLYWGRGVIGLGIGMVVGAIAWPFFQKRIVQLHGAGNPGSRFFVVLAISLLISAVITGFGIRNGILQLSSRSYFKIFEFFGPTLVVTWVLTPIFHRLMIRSDSETWLATLNLPRQAFEEMAYTSIAIGYPLYTVGALFAGAIWAEQAWGTWWSWDPKEVGALIIWLFYTGFLHARYQREWKGARAAVLIVLGMIFVFVSFFGNYFFGGLHSFEVAG